MSMPEAARLMAPALLAAGTAQAQTSPYQGTPTPQLSYPGGIASQDTLTGAAVKSYEVDPLRGPRETPTMRRLKLARAVALRDEAARLQAADGGTLSPAHVRYVQRRARSILGDPPNATGTLVPVR